MKYLVHRKLYPKANVGQHFPIHSSSSMYTSCFPHVNVFSLLPSGSPGHQLHFFLISTSQDQMFFSQSDNLFAVYTRGLPLFQACF